MIIEKANEQTEIECERESTNSLSIADSVPLTNLDQNQREPTCLQTEKVDFIWHREHHPTYHELEREKQGKAKAK